MILVTYYLALCSVESYVLLFGKGAVVKSRSRGFLDLSRTTDMRNVSILNLMLW